MASVNKVILVGNLVADPECRYMPSGDAIANVRLATNETWKDKATGEKKEATEFHRVSFFGKAAEVIGQYAKKGGSLYVEGKIQTRKWTDKETGADRYSTEIRGEVFQFLGGRSSDARQDSPSQSTRTQVSSGGGFGSDLDDSIPF